MGFFFLLILCVCYGFLFCSIQASDGVRNTRIFAIIKAVCGNVSSSSFTWCSIALSIYDSRENQVGSKGKCTLYQG